MEKKQGTGQAYDWDDMRFLLALKRHRTMSAAAVTLDTNVATVSRRIERLSTALGTILFIRSARQGWDATPAAVRLASIAERFDSEITQESNLMAMEMTGSAHGSLSISAPPFCASVVLMPNISEFLFENEGVELGIRSRTVSEGLGDDDIMVRVGRPDSGRLVTRRLTSMTLRMYRSSLAPEENEGWIGSDNQFGRAAGDVIPDEEIGPMRLRVTDFESQLIAMRTTGLAGALPDEVTVNLPDMYPVGECGGEELEIWMAYHATRRMDPLIHLGCNWLLGCFGLQAAGKHAPEAEAARAPDATHTRAGVAR